MIEVYTQSGGKVGRQTLESLSLDRATAWIDVTNPTPNELASVKEKFDIPLTELRHTLDSKERSRVKTTNAYTMVIFSAYNESGEYPSSPVGIFFTKKYVLTIHHDRMKAFVELDVEHDLFQKVMQRGISSLLYTLLFRIIKEYFKLMEKMEDILDRIEEEAVYTYSKEVVQRISHLKTVLAYTHKALVGNHEVLSTLAKMETTKEGHLFDDLDVEIMQIRDETEIFIERVNAVLYIHLAAVQNRANEVMKYFTYLAYIWLFPVFITGLYGMNVNLPLEKNPYAFWIIIVATLAVVVILNIIYTKKKWE